MTDENPHGAGGGRARVALVGAGNIARRYVAGMARFPELELVGVTDAIPELAQALADEIGATAYASLDELLADPAIEVVVNITPPTVHAAVTEQALNAGKHVYSEKPIADTLEAGRSNVETARQTGNAFGVAPDTFLGSAGRTARRAVDGGVIGEVIGASIFVTHSKAELWHPDPTFLFQRGGGPLLDMGPYYVTALVNLLGPIAQVSGFARIGATQRRVVSPGRRVDQIEVSTPTHAGATFRTTSGVVVSAIFSFDIWDSDLPRIELYGTEGTLSLPDPNGFDGPVRFRAHDADDWTTLPPVGDVSGETDTPTQLLRGYGVRDLVHSLAGEPHRVDASLALHVLDVLEAVQRSSDSGTTITLSTTTERPESISNVPLTIPSTTLDRS